MSSYYSIEELEEIGFNSIGKNVYLSKKVSIYSPDKMVIGNNVRIDDFCILSGKITIGNNIHIAAYCSFFGGSEGIEMRDFSTISSRGAIYALSDDYSGEYMTNPMINEEFTNVKEEKVIVGKHVIIGTNCTILPGSYIEDGAAFGAHSLITGNCKGWNIYAGIPVRKIKDRKKMLLQYEDKII